MSKSGRVRLADELAILRLVNECRELGDDAAAWQGHLIAGLLARTGGLIVGVGPAPPPRAGMVGVVPDWVAHHWSGGWPSPAVRDRLVRATGDVDMIRAHPAVAAFHARPEPTLTLTRRELADDRTWDRSAFVNDRLRADGMDEGLVARAPVPVVGCQYLVTVVRAKGERPFEPAAGRLTATVLRELTPHLGRALLLTTQPNRHGLPPRTRLVLDCLLDGDSEKEAALRLGLRPASVHDHVKRLYRHFGVGSRAQLLAYFLRRHRG